MRGDRGVFQLGKQPFMPYTVECFASVKQGYICWAIEVGVDFY